MMKLMVELRTPMSRAVKSAVNQALSLLLETLRLDELRSSPYFGCAACRRRALSRMVIAVWTI